MSSTTWDIFWKDQRQSFNAAMKIATGYFVTQLEKLYQLKPTSAIFDYGCGPGFVADSLADKSIQITGADINEFFIEECRKNHPASLFMVITTDISTNKKILDEQLKEKRFDYILLLSVAQYFKNTGELEELIRMLRFYMKENGKIIVADVIDENTSSIRDALSLLLHYIKIGKVPTFFRFMFYLMFSNYRKISGKIPLLQIPEQAVRDIAASNELNYEKVKGLTIQPTRSNYIFSNKG
jgi:2-polyprenyl-3-methyl-5-hydroxy-6-metoxy-1,4-benzoquinol methylase